MTNKRFLPALLLWLVPASLLATSPVESLLETLDARAEIGFMVYGVTADGPAAEAGIERGDLLLQFEGKPFGEIGNPDGLPEELGAIDGLLEELRAHLGERIQVRLLHGDEARTVLVEVRKNENAPDRPTIGIAGAPVAVVREVHPGGRGAKLGLLAGDVVATYDSRASVNGRIELQITRDGVMRSLREE